MPWYSNLLLLNVTASDVAMAMSRSERSGFVFARSDRNVFIYEKAEYGEVEAWTIGALLTQILNCRGMSVLMASNSLWVSAFESGATRDIYVSDPESWEYLIARPPYGNAEAFTKALGVGHLEEDVNRLFSLGRTKSIWAYELHVKLFETMNLQFDGYDHEFESVCHETQYVVAENQSGIGMLNPDFTVDRANTYFS